VVVSFHTTMRPKSSVCAFAETFVHSDRERPLSLWVGAGGAIKVWWNGERVLQDGKYRRPDQDRHATMVGAREGANRVLVKNCIADGDWGFYMRIADRRGGPVEGVRADPEPPASPVLI
jgi:hypothetical protein